MKGKKKKKTQLSPSCEASSKIFFKISFSSAQPEDPFETSFLNDFCFLAECVWEVTAGIVTDQT